MKRLGVLVATLIFLASCGNPQKLSVDGPSRIQEQLAFERTLSANDCQTPSKVDRQLLQQSWRSSNADSLLAFGDSGLNEYSTGLTASYCLDGTTIVGRGYTETPQFSIAGHVVRAFSRAANPGPPFKWQIVELTRHELVLKDLTSTAQTVWRRTD